MILVSTRTGVTKGSELNQIVRFIQITILLAPTCTCPHQQPVFTFDWPGDEMSKLFGDLASIIL